MNIERGAEVILKSTGSGVQDSYPAANWIAGEIRATLLEDGVVGTCDVFDVAADGEERSVYGFNILAVAHVYSRAAWRLAEEHEAELVMSGCEVMTRLVDGDTIEVIEFPGEEG